MARTHRDLPPVTRRPTRLTPAAVDELRALQKARRKAKANGLDVPEGPIRIRVDVERDYTNASRRIRRRIEMNERRATRRVAAKAERPDRDDTAGPPPNRRARRMSAALTSSHRWRKISRRPRGS